MYVYGKASFLLMLLSVAAMYATTKEYTNAMHFLGKGAISEH